jgi:hypothetical protein
MILLTTDSSFAFFGQVQKRCIRVSNGLGLSNMFYPKLQIICFIQNYRLIVTRPISVFGMIEILSSDHSKCSFQTSVRGLKSATVLFVGSSKISVLSDLRRLQ